MEATLFGNEVEAAAGWTAAGGAPPGTRPADARSSHTGLVSAAYVPGHVWGNGVGDVPVGHLGIEIAQGGALLRFVGEKRPGKAPENVKRGKVRGMSPASRLRQKKRINAIDRTKVKKVLFVTMTLRRRTSSADDQQLPAFGVVESWDKIEAARRKWFKRLERFLAGRQWFAIWRKEPTDMGMAHLHVLIFFLDDIDPPAKGCRGHARDPWAFWLVATFRPWNDLAWAECVGDPSIEHTACSSELMKGWGGVTAYLTKYLGKEQDLRDSEIETGKVWDIVHRDLMPVDWSRECVKRPVGVLAQRACRKWQQRKAESWQAQFKNDDGETYWQTLRPKVVPGRVISVIEHVERLKSLGVRVRRRRPRLSCTRDIQLWIEEPEGMRPADLSRDLDLRDSPGVFEVKDENGVTRTVERTTFYTSTFFLPAVEAQRVIEWAKREVVARLTIEAVLPF